MISGSPFECAIEDNYAGIAGGGLELESISDCSLLPPGIITAGLEAVIAGTSAFVDLEKKGTEAVPEIAVHGKRR
jgi:hypothetical protein